jgi:5'-deoxynucleotidase YfbR-like HD superfamily hydrolase
MDNPWIETWSGKKFYFLDPQPDMIDIQDIAHALAMQCRYTGHCATFYSVAEHSVIVSMITEPENALAGLLHDASEAYLIDVASPVKPYLTNFKELEDKIMQVIAFKFGFQYPLVEDVHDADKAQLKTEAKYLMASGGADWVQEYPTKKVGKVPKCLQPFDSKNLFLSRFWELSEDKHGLTINSEKQIILLN